jgi:hypothetical protein
MVQENAEANNTTGKKTKTKTNKKRINRGKRRKTGDALWTVTVTVSFWEVALKNDIGKTLHYNSAYAIEIRNVVLTRMM